MKKSTYVLFLVICVLVFLDVSNAKQQPPAIDHPNQDKPNDPYPNYKRSLRGGGRPGGGGSRGGGSRGSGRSSGGRSRAGRSSYTMIYRSSKTYYTRNYSYGRSFVGVYQYYLPPNYYDPIGWYSPKYTLTYYNGYGYNFYYGEYGYYKTSPNMRGPEVSGWSTFNGPTKFVVVFLSFIAFYIGGLLCLCFLSCCFK